MHLFQKSFWTCPQKCVLLHIVLFCQTLKGFLLAMQEISMIPYGCEKVFKGSLYEHYKA